jgi:succinate dehydrogenase hydrophobic anchor subunit
VAQGWVTTYWAVMQMLIVFFGATHGFNGLRNVIEDHVTNRIAQSLVRALLSVLWLAVLGIAFYIIATS